MFGQLSRLKRPERYSFISNSRALWAQTASRARACRKQIMQGPRVMS